MSASETPDNIPSFVRFVDWPTLLHCLLLYVPIICMALICWCCALCHFGSCKGDKAKFQEAKNSYKRLPNRPQVPVWLFKKDYIELKYIYWFCQIFFIITISILNCNASLFTFFQSSRAKQAVHGLFTFSKWRQQRAPCIICLQLVIGVSKAKFIIDCKYFTMEKNRVFWKGRRNHDARSIPRE